MILLILTGGIESTEHGQARALFSDTKAAAVVCGTISPIEGGLGQRDLVVAAVTESRLLIDRVFSPTAIQEHRKDQF